MSSVPASSAAPQSSASDNVSDLMCAIQRVLAEHNVSDARFILELPNSQYPTTATVTTEGDAQDVSDPLSKHEEEEEEKTVAASTALLMDLKATPACAPPTPPAHQRPPPRARSASAEPAAPNTPHTTPPSVRRAATPPSLQEEQQEEPPQAQDEQQSPLPRPSPPSPDNSAAQLDTTACPTTDPKTLVTPTSATTAARTREALSLVSPLQYSLPSTESHATSLTNGRAAQPSLTSDPAGKVDHPLPSSSCRTSTSIVDELAQLRRLSHAVVQEVASVEGRTQVKEPLQAFVGRSAILEDRRKRQSASATSQWSPSTGLPLFPTPPSLATPTRHHTSPTTTTSSSLHRPPAFQPTSSHVTGGAVAAGGSPASVFITSSTDSLTPSSHSLPSQRRSVVLISSPDYKGSNAAGGCGAGVNGGGGGCGGGGCAASAVPSASSLPSLVAVKKSAKPGRTPVFSILNKEGNSYASSNSSTSTTASSNTNNSGSIGGAATPRLLTSSSAKAGTSGTSGSVYASHHARPMSVSLMADDRNPPSPVFQPLVGSAAEEQACHQPSILIQPGQPAYAHARVFSPSKAAVHVAETTTNATNTTAATAAPHAAATDGAAAASATSTPAQNSADSPTPPPQPSFWWSEQSRENARRALQLQSQSRLSQTTETMTSASDSAAAADGGGGGGAGTKYRRLFNPALSAKAVKSGGEVLPPSPASQPPSTFSSVFKATGVNSESGGGGDAAAATTETATTGSPHSTARTTTAPSPRRPSLREMLLEQQQLEDASRRGMQEHARLMQAARAVHSSSSSAAAALTPSAKPFTLPYPSDSSSVASTPGATTGAIPATAATSDEVNASVLASNTVKAGSSSSDTRTSSGGGAGGPRTSEAGIQVVKFTLPQDAEARQSAVQQLCRSSSGIKHVDSKDRYRTLLASQKKDLSKKDEKEEKYKDLLSRAVEYNRLQRPQ